MEKIGIAILHTKQVTDDDMGFVYRRTHARTPHIHTHARPNTRTHRYCKMK